MKTCSKCGDEFPATTEYWHKHSYRADGLNPRCKPCERERNREVMRKRYATPEGREASREANRKRLATPKGREANRVSMHKYYQSGKYQVYMENNPLAKLRQKLSSLIGKSMKAKGFSKNTKTAKLLGCDFEFFQLYIGEQFTDGMSWDNQGEWHFDHILPCSSATTEAELIALQYFSNFQPMWRSENLSKGSTLPPDWQERKQKLMVTLRREVSN